MCFNPSVNAYSCHTMFAKGSDFRLDNYVCFEIISLEVKLRLRVKRWTFNTE